MAKPIILDNRTDNDAIQWASQTTQIAHIKQWANLLFTATLKYGYLGSVKDKVIWSVEDACIVLAET